MASNVEQDTIPYYWTSANDDVIYRFKFKPYSIDSVSGSGNVYINLQNDFDVMPVVGEYLYIDGSIYNGRHKIIQVIGTSSVIIDEPFAGSIASNAFNCYHLRVPVFNFYKGIYGGSDPNLPYTFVSAVKPSVTYPSSSIPYIEINVRGLTKYIFNIIPNTVANSVDYSMFNAINFLWDDQITLDPNSSLAANSLVLNCGLTNEQLQYKYVGWGIFLGPTDKPLIATSGVSFATVIFNTLNDGYPTLLKFIDGNQV